MTAFTIDNNNKSIYAFLHKADSSFQPPLSKRLSITDYAKKLADHAQNIFAVRSNKNVAHAALYVNDLEHHKAFLSSIAVLPEFCNQGIGEQLMLECFSCAKAHGMKYLVLEVSHESTKAIALYKRNGFTSIEKLCCESLVMQKLL